MSAVVENVVSLGNSTILSLSGSQSFVGIAENVLSFQEIDITTVGSPAVAPGTLIFEFSPDGVNWDVSTPIELTGPSPVPLILRVVLPFFRVRYVNGPTPLTTLRISTLFHRSPSLPAQLTKYLNQGILPLDPTITTRAVIAAQTPTGSFENAQMDAEGAIFVTGLSGSIAVVTTASISTGHTTQNLAASLTSQIALNANPNRLGASFFNTFASKGNLYISLGSSASTGSFLAAVRPGGYYSFDTVTSEQVSFVFDGVPGNVMVNEQT